MNWKYRFFVLVDGIHMEYYTDPSRKEMKGKYSLCASCEVKVAHISGPTDFLFCIEDKRLGTIHYLGAACEEDRKQWIELLESNIRQLGQLRRSRLETTASKLLTGECISNELSADIGSGEMDAPTSSTSTTVEVKETEKVEEVEEELDEDEDDSEDEEIPAPSGSNVPSSITINGVVFKVDKDSDDEDDEEDEEEEDEEMMNKLNSAPSGLYGNGDGSGSGNDVGGAWSKGPIMLRKTGNGGTDSEKSGGSDDSGIKYAKDTIELLNAQLISEGKKPLEYMPLKELKAELAKIFAKVNAGEAYDEARMDHLLKCMEFNPEYRAEKAREAAKWREQSVQYSQDCLQEMRGFVPTNIFTSSLADLRAAGMSNELSKRIYSKRCLWLVRMTTEELCKLHDADLLGRYGTEALGLDLVELCAIYAVAPTKFVVDNTGKKEIWRSSLEGQVRKMMAEKEANTLIKSKLRNAAYKNQTPLFIRDMGWKKMEKVSSEGAFAKRTSFVTVCTLESEGEEDPVDQEVPGESINEQLARKLSKRESRKHSEMVLPPPNKSALSSLFPSTPATPPRNNENATITTTSSAPAVHRPPPHPFGGGNGNPNPMEGLLAALKKRQID